MFGPCESEVVAAREDGFSDVRLSDLDARGARRGQALPILSLNRNWHLLVGFWFSTPKVRPDPVFGTLPDLDLILEAIARPKPFGLGKLPDSIYVNAEEIGYLGTNLEILLRETSVCVPRLAVPKELQQTSAA